MTERDFQLAKQFIKDCDCKDGSGVAKNRQRIHSHVETGLSVLHLAPDPKSFAKSLSEKEITDTLLSLLHLRKWSFVSQMYIQEWDQIEATYHKQMSRQISQFALSFTAEVKQYCQSDEFILLFDALIKRKANMDRPKGDRIFDICQDVVKQMWLEAKYEPYYEEEIFER